jgi:hypothetical protein
MSLVLFYPVAFCLCSFFSAAQVFPKPNLRKAWWDGLTPADLKGQLKAEKETLAAEAKEVLSSVCAVLLRMSMQLGSWVVSDR